MQDHYGDLAHRLLRGHNADTLYEIAEHIGWLYTQADQLPNKDKYYRQLAEHYAVFATLPNDKMFERCLEAANCLYEHMR